MKALQQIIDQEKKKQRVTIYSDDRLVMSLTENSLVEEMEEALNNFSHSLTKDSVNTLKHWHLLAREKVPDDDGPIRLSTLDGRNHSILTRDTDPDILSAAIRDRKDELGKVKSKLVEGWITDGQKRLPDHENRIRLFNQGFDHGKDSTEVDLSKLSIHSIELILERLTQTSGLAILPEHKKRLDKRYEKLLKEKDLTQHKEPEELEVPVGIEGKVLKVSPDMKEQVLWEVHERYAGNLNEEDRSLLWKWVCKAPREWRTVDITVYDRSDLRKFQSFDRELDQEEIESALASEEKFVTSYDRERARRWIDVLSPELRKERWDVPTIEDLHFEDQINEIFEGLEDEERQAGNLRRLKNISEPDELQKSTLAADRRSDSELFVKDRVFSCMQPLEQLKELAASFVDTGFEELPAEDAKKLLTWIHTKEKYGDDCYKDKASDLDGTAAAANRPEKRQVDMAVTEILSDLNRVPKKEKQKEKLKDKDEPFPSV